MNKVIQLREAQMIMLEMLKEVDRICNKHDIKYWLDSGTLLGAIRHKGFIPWDDDMDIAMEREDYIKFKKIANDEINNRFFIKSPLEDSKFGATWIKVIDKGSHRNHHYETIDNDGGGVFIDILPYDCVCKKNNLRKKIWGRFIDLKWSCDVLDKNKKSFYLKLLIAKGYKVIGYENIINKIFKNADKLEIDETSEFINYGSETPWNLHLKRENIYPLKHIEFEGYIFLVPNNYKEVLESAYGDWRTLPSKDKQVPIHSEVIYTRDWR